MGTYKCDRCGAFYNHSNRFGREIYITSSCMSYGFIKDLCDECQNKLEAWWTEKKEAESEE